jgi:lysylphosphatidylglycerol synthetase-like protein (DUF2156 family)
MAKQKHIAKKLRTLQHTANLGARKSDAAARRGGKVRRPALLSGASPCLWHNSRVSEAHESERLRVLALLKRHGDEATSFQMLEPGHRYYIEPDACVAYADVGSAWVTVGEPVCAEDAIPQVVERFSRRAREQG